MVSSDAASVTTGIKNDTSASASAGTNTVTTTAADAVVANHTRDANTGSGISSSTSTVRVPISKSKMSTNSTSTSTTRTTTTPSSSVNNVNKSNNGMNPTTGSNSSSISTTGSTAMNSTTTSSSSSKRKRRTIRKPYYYSSSAVEHIENRCLMQAIQNSKVDRQIRRSSHHSDKKKKKKKNTHPYHANGENTNNHIDADITTSSCSNSSGNNNNYEEEEEEEEDDDDEKDIPFGPVFFPTIQQFVYMDPIQYITEHVQPIAIQYGICKIVPPLGWQNHIQKFFSIPIVDVDTTGGTNTNGSDHTNSDLNQNDDTNNANDNATVFSSTSTTDVLPSTPHGSHDNNQSSSSISSATTTTTTPPMPVTPNSTTSPPSTVPTNTTTTTTTATQPETVPKNESSKRQKAFETKYQLLHRIQEGIDFQDGNMYTSTEYIQMAYQQTLQYKNTKYPLHDLLSKYQTNTNNDNNNSNNNSSSTTFSNNNDDAPQIDNPHSTNKNCNESQQDNETNDETSSNHTNNNVKNTNVSQRLYSLQNLEQDYWDIVEMVQPSSDHNSKFVVEYGNDVDTHIYGSGFPLSYDPNKSIYTATDPTKTMRNRKLSRDDSQRTKKNNKPTTSRTDDDTTTATAAAATTTTTTTSSNCDSHSTNGHNDENVDETKAQELFKTEAYYRDTLWNVNNIPCAPRSVLRHVKVAINGINVPWMYYGSLFTTFCWHNEDNYLYSINYHHMGSPKQWYGVPGIPKDGPEGLEKVFKSYLSMKMRDVPDLLHHITTMFSPRLVQNRNVPVYKMIQYEGEFIITFPRAYHCGFSYGPNIGEAVNFATSDWIPYGSDANEKYRMNQRPAVFSHDRLVYTMANHCIRDQESYHTCKLIVNELQRIVDEELSLRTKLLNSGVRDVSNLIHLRPNRFDQLDEASANYDDQRTCHYCKYICYFTAVACQCSHSKVSCLRHSHFMCTCVNSSKYLMIWSTKAELLATLERVKKHCDYLQEKEKNSSDNGSMDATPVVRNSDSKSKTKKNTIALPAIAPGVLEDYERHKNDQILTDPRNWMKKERNTSKPTF